MIDIEALTQIVENINEAKEDKAIMLGQRADIANELLVIALDEDDQIPDELRERLRHVEHQIDLAEETIEASKSMLLAMIDEEDDAEGEI